LVFYWTDVEKNLQKFRRLFQDDRENYKKVKVTRDADTLRSFKTYIEIGSQNISGLRIVLIKEDYLSLFPSKRLSMCEGSLEIQD
jgi:hypothetical protein